MSAPHVGTHRLSRHRRAEEAPFQFANVLFAGPCNRACPWCIGRALPARVNVNNLDVFPPRGIEALIEAVNEHRVPEVVFTGP